MKQNEMTAEQASTFVNELGFARLTQPRTRLLHADEPVQGPRQVFLPRPWRGREAELHEKLNESVLPALEAARRQPFLPITQQQEFDAMLSFAKRVKCQIKPEAERQRTSLSAQRAA